MKTLKLKKRLPNKLSGLIAVALADLAKTEANPNYRIDMDTWHTPGLNQCAVCFAGSVMVQRACGLRANKTCFPSSFSDSNIRKFSALNALRNGHVELAFLALKSERRLTRSEKNSLHQLDRTIEAYESSPECFKADMAELRGALKAAGY